MSASKVDSIERIKEKVPLAQLQQKFRDQISQADALSITLGVDENGAAINETVAFARLVKTNIKNCIENGTTDLVVTSGINEAAQRKVPILSASSSNKDAMNLTANLAAMMANADDYRWMIKVVIADVRAISTGKYSETANPIRNSKEQWALDDFTFIDSVKNSVDEFCMNADQILSDPKYGNTFMSNLLLVQHCCPKKL